MNLFCTRSHIQCCHIWGLNPHVPCYDAPSTLFYSRPGSDSIHSARYDTSPSRCAGRSFHLSLSKWFLEFFSSFICCNTTSVGRALIGTETPSQLVRRLTTSVNKEIITEMTRQRRHNVRCAESSFAKKPHKTVDKFFRYPIGS